MPFYADRRRRTGSASAEYLSHGAHGRDKVALLWEHILLPPCVLGPVALSANDREQAAPTHRPRPAPHLPSMRAVTDREEDDFGAADDILERHIADPAPRRRDPAVVRVVTVVAHHEEMPGRY